MIESVANIPKSIAFVLPRYGADLGGGAEALSRNLIHLLASVHPELTIEVWTTCAKDHRTWENFHPEGETSEQLENGNTVKVRRFPVDARNLEIFIKAELAYQEGRLLSAEDQLSWIENSVNSRALYQHIANFGPTFDCLLFAPYLFATSFWGALIYPERSILIPCLHNEHYAYLDIIRHLIERVSYLIFNTDAEARLAAELYGPGAVEGRSSVVGMSFEPFGTESFDQTELSAMRAKFNLSKPYVLYSGRKEQGKNLDTIVRYFRAAEPVELDLLIIGAGDIGFDMPLPDSVRDLGFVSEREKAFLMQEALCLVQPSLNESFSIVMMEAWLRGTPVVVHSDCPVTREHVEKSGGGLHFKNFNEFDSVVALLAKDRKLRDRLGASGKEYVVAEYSNYAVYRRLTLALQRFAHVRYSYAEPRKAVSVHLSS